MLSRLNSVRSFFESDAKRYAGDRYPDVPRTCEQYSYGVRRKYVLSMLDDGTDRPGVILDLGCGPGVYTSALLDRGWNVCGVDLSQQMLRVARQGVSDRRGALFCSAQTTALPFADARFDAVICIGVMSYVEDDRRTVAEIARVLKPGGCAIVQAANLLAPVLHEHRLRFIVRRRILRRPLDEEDKLLNEVQLTAHRLSRVARLCGEAGLLVRDRRFYDFRAPLIHRIAPDLALALARRFEPHGRSALLASWGSGFLVRAARP